MNGVNELDIIIIISLIIFFYLVFWKNIIKPALEGAGLIGGKENELFWIFCVLVCSNILSTNNLW